MARSRLWLEGDPDLVSGEYAVVGLISLGLLVYLCYVLLKPEKF